MAVGACWGLVGGRGCDGSGDAVMQMERWEGRHFISDPSSEAAIDRDALGGKNNVIGPKSRQPRCRCGGRVGARST